MIHHLTWDFRETLNPDELVEFLTQLGLYARSVEDGSDQFYVVASDKPLPEKLDEEEE